MSRKTRHDAELIRQTLDIIWHIDHGKVSTFSGNYDDYMHSLALKRSAIPSWGERARLSLAQIAAISPKLLILDEVTNNLDLETRAHVIHVLQKYPGAMIIVSHDDAFLAALNISEKYQITNQELQLLDRQIDNERN